MCCVLFHFSRSETEHTKEVVKPYDWTYTTDYKGTLLGDTATLKVSIFPLLHAVYLLFQPNTEHFFFFLDLSVGFYKFCMVLSFWPQSMPWAFHVSHRVLSIKSQLIKKTSGLVVWFFLLLLGFCFCNSNSSYFSDKAHPWLYFTMRLKLPTAHYCIQITCY